MENISERQRTGGVRNRKRPRGFLNAKQLPPCPYFCIMQNIKESQAQTENVQRKPWTGQDNTNLPVYYFGTFVKWVDVDRDHNPVKDYIEALEQIVWRINPGIFNGQLFRTVRNLRNDLVELDKNIERIMQEGGVQ